MFEAPTAPALPHGWRDVVLGDLGEFSTSSVDKKVNTAELPVRLVNYMDVYRSPYLTSQFDYMQVTASRPEIAKSQVLAGDLLFTPSSETPDDVGHSAVVVEALPDTLHSYHTVRLRIAASEAIDLRFRGRFANSSLVLKHFEKCATGSTRYTLSLADFRSAPVRIPPIAEQAKIAQILDTLDTTIRQTEAIIAKLKQVKQGLLHDLLTRGIDANGELRPPQSEAPHLYKASPLGWIPVEWRVQPVSALVRYVTYGFTNPMPTTTDGPWMLTAADIGDGQVDYTKARKTNPSDFSRLSPKSRPSIGDILITKDGTLGRVAVLDQGGVCVNQSVAVLPPSDPAQGAFLALYLRSPTGQDRMLADAGGSTIKHLYITTLASMLVPSPEPEEAALIGQRVSAAEARISQEIAALDKLFKLKSGLMDDLLTGRVRVTPLLTPPATT